MKKNKVVSKGLSKEVTFNLEDDTEEAELMTSIHFPFIFGSNWNFGVLFKGVYNLGSFKQINHYLTIHMFYH